MMNTNILLCLFTILIVIFFSLKYQIKNEHFTNTQKIYTYNIIPDLNETSYIGTFIPNDKNNYKGNLIYTNSLKSGQWSDPLKNSLTSENSIIVDLNYNIDERLMCVSLTGNSNEKEYNIFIKENNDKESLWLPLKSDHNSLGVFVLI